MSIPPKQNSNLFLYLILILAFSSIYYYSKNDTSPATVNSQSEYTEISSTQKKPVNINKSQLQSEISKNEVSKSTQNIPPVSELNRHQIKSFTENKPQGSVQFKLSGKYALLQNDIIIGEVEDVSLVKNNLGFTKEPEVRRWPTFVIPYYIDSKVNNPERIRQAIQMFNSTRLKFVELTTQKDALIFENEGEHCLSYLGYVGGHQPIFLNDKCDASAIAHEIMHALGFVHEQNRFDRDEFLKINWQNINPNEKINFEKFSEKLSQFNLIKPFDFNSIMIYEENFFSINNLPTIESLSENNKIKPSSQLSDSDLSRINEIY